MRRVGGRAQAIELTTCRVDSCGLPAYGRPVYLDLDPEGQCLAHAKDRLWPVERGRLIRLGCDPKQLRP